MLRKTLSQTLNSEIERLGPWNKSLLSIKRWSDSLRPPFRGLAHKTLHKYMEWWYEKPIYLHMKPVDEQIEIIRGKHGSDEFKKPSKVDNNYLWDGNGDWHR